MKILNLVVSVLFTSVAFIPQASFALTNEEIEEKLELLTEELAISQEQYEDASDKSKSFMSISGYTDFEYITSSKSGSNNQFRLHHLSLFFEKQISEKWRFFSEIEYEDAPKFEANDKFVLVDTDGDNIPDTQIAVFDDAKGEIFVEAVNVSYFASSAYIFRMGRFFTPAGIWSVNHYPAFVPTQERPQHIRRIFPQVVDGVDLFGTIAFGESSFFNYDLFTGNGEGNTAKEDKNSKKATGLRTSFLLPFLSHFELGMSYYSDTLNDRSEKEATGIHAKMRSGDLAFQAEFAQGEIKDTTDNIVDNEGYYAQLLYDISNWTIGVRYDFFDNNTAATDVSSKFGKVSSVFVNYRSTEKVVLKLELHQIDVEDSLAEDYTKALASVVVYLGE